jgi:hypothetical protein
MVSCISRRSAPRSEAESRYASYASISPRRCSSASLGPRPRASKRSLSRGRVLPARCRRQRSRPRGRCRARYPRAVPGCDRRACACGRSPFTNEPDCLGRLEPYAVAVAPRHDIEMQRGGGDVGHQRRGGGLGDAGVTQRGRHLGPEQATGQPVAFRVRVERFDAHNQLRQPDEGCHDASSLGPAVSRNARAGLDMQGQCRVSAQ